MIDQLYSLAREYTDLTEVQARILTHIRAAIGFAADISRNQIYICAPGKNKDMIVILAAGKPSFDTRKTYFSPGETFLTDEFAITSTVLKMGKKVVGRKELAIGRIVGITAYPVLDNAGIPFAVIGIMASGIRQQQVLTDTANQILQVPLPEREYRAVRPQDGVIILDAVGRIMYANDPASGITLVFGNENIDKAVEGKLLAHLPMVQEVMEKGRVVQGEEKAGPMTLSIWALPLMQSGRVMRIILLVSDITAVREKEQQLLVKESVIKEIHHRVKNSLNTVAGLLRMQSRRSDNPETRSALKKAVDRIVSISQVHDILAHQSGEDIDWEILLDKLCDLSVRSLGGGGIRLERIRAQGPVILSSDKAVHLSIAVNELIHNAIGHGLEGQEQGILRVEDRVEGDSLHIIIQNNGELLPEGFGKKSYGLGLQIVTTLVELELRGTFCFVNEGDRVSAEITCPLKEDR